MYDKYDCKNTPRFLAEEQIDMASRSKCDPPMNRQLPDEFNPDSHRAEKD